MRLTEILGRRSLMPKVSVNSSARDLRVINGDHKTLMRIELRQDRVVVPQTAKFFKLPDTIYLFPLRGFDKVCEKPST